MKQHRGRVIHVETLEELDRRLAQGATTLRGWRLRGLDLSERTEMLEVLTVTGASFLGCRFAPGDVDRLESRGALVLPEIPEVPVDVYRASLYSPADLYDTLAEDATAAACGYAASLDARAYAWSQEQGGAEDALARTLHDHSVDEALEAWVVGRDLVGVMGGHRLQRGQEEYAVAARLGRALGCSTGPRGLPLVVATGGGPGAMEAANLGAYLAGHDGSALDAALTGLAGVPTYRPSIEDWARRALEVRTRFADGQESLGIPTWHYGHEPPNAFAESIAKYFRNSQREAVLLQVCNAGIVFLPGAAGTVQEVFQDACENYYADETSVAPMVLLGRRHWTEELPVWPLLERLARGRAMEGRVHLADSIEETVALLAG